MFCSDAQTLAQRAAPRETPPCFPEQVYATSNGIESGVSTIGFRSGRYAPEEARTALENRLALAQLDVDVGEKNRSDNRNMMMEAEEQSKADFQNTTERLRERLTDLHLWKTEMEKEILKVIDMSESLLRRLAELNTSLKALDECVLLTTDCLNARQRRFGEDLQQDEVELQLIKELDILNKAIALIKRSIEQVNDQLNRNRLAKTNLEKAWSDKHEADMLDTEGAHLTPESTNKQHYAGEARSWPQAAQSTVKSWTQHAHDLILSSEHERIASDNLLQLCENILHDVERDVIQQKDTVNAAFQRRLDEYECEKKNLTDKLRKTCDEIAKMEQSIKELENAIVAKDAHVQTVQTRLHLHNQRQNVENCRDPPQKAMLDEMHNVEETIDKLRNQLSNTENNLRHLQDEQMALEKQIHMKNASIQVDRDHCARHRMHFPASTRLRGH
ncbi:tektin a1 [Echinococcus multilocularis]|uniref:Tektin n=1 Tax=Echinococcus multilocularis TaxID=6211 RepID=A0A068Y979_ECHMU|nr:tektin a1 [Echinococcus multilocularis]